VDGWLKPNLVNASRRIAAEKLHLLLPPFLHKAILKLFKSSDELIW
jgi:hypothetical protein